MLWSFLLSHVYTSWENDDSVMSIIYCNLSLQRKHLLIFAKEKWDHAEQAVSR